MIIVSILVALFAMQNAMVVELNFIFWEFTASLVVVIVSAFALGILVALCFMLYMKAKNYMKTRKMQDKSFSKIFLRKMRLFSRLYDCARCILTIRLLFGNV